MKSIVDSFKLWSTRSKEIKEELSPRFSDMGFRDMDKSEMAKMWKYLKPILFKLPSTYLKYDQDILIPDLVTASVYKLNTDNKYKSYGQNTLEAIMREDLNLAAAEKDFELIFFNETDNVILELLSYYFFFYLRNIEHYVSKNVYKDGSESKKEFQKRKKEKVIFNFKEIAEDINDIFEQFSIKYVLTINGFVPRQDKKIINEVYTPVLVALSDEKWKEVNVLLRDAFEAHHRKTKQGYSDSISNAVSALEAYLQICLYGETGKGTLGGLVSEAIESGYIPDDLFSSTVIKQLAAYLARERKETSSSHPKKEYSTEKNSRLLLNIIMVFIQHSLQSNK